MFVMLPKGILVIVLISTALATDPTNPACSVKLPVGDHKGDIYKNILKWKEPASSPSTGGVDFSCETGFVDDNLKKSKEHFECKGGLYNGKYTFPDLLCKSDFHKDVRVQKVKKENLGSQVFQCSLQGWEVNEISRKTNSSEKLLYKVCLDTNTMRPKFSFRVASPEKLVVRRLSREDVWGFDGYGKNAAERMRLSQGYVKKIQRDRVTQAFPNKYDKNNPYPYYFNRGHLVAYADFLDEEDQKATVEYINAAPQWEVLNEHSWTLVEREARSMLQANPADWEIYTGTYGRIQTPVKPGFLFALPARGSDKALLPIPLLFWKLVHNTKDSNQTRAFIGINNPEVRTIPQIVDIYRLCQTPIRRDGKLVQGDEYKGFTYECPVDEFLQRLNAEEKVVK